jgi:DNA polymerase III epsilon subunit-like protein
MGRAGSSVLKFIIPDIETTGRRTYNSKIVEVAAVVLDQNFAEIERWSSLVNPGPEALALAQPKAMEVNKLTMDELKDAPSTADAAAGFQALVERHPEATIHAFNNEFDSWFLALPPWNVPLKRWGECIMLAAMEIMDNAGALGLRYNGSSKFPNLREAIAFFKLTSETSHRAIGDARAAADVFIEVLRQRRSCPYDAEVEQETKYFLSEGL